ncbi:ArsR/SmtB family transcription factor [Kitasatospora sp. NPDC090091]|uniref:ArsR/SmtB family transcription factor n=1 Tax=Kitasatospora sp. NPDC090091 TaxID=3364081 RepID=UPI00380FFE86
MAENAEQQAGTAGAGGRPEGRPDGRLGGRPDERPDERLPERRVDDVATLKALADPLRLAILGALSSARSQPGPDGGSLTVKEIAAALAEPQTKLYRHIKQLEKAGLIRVAGTRLVSGIVESRYAVAHESVRLSSEIFSAGSPARSEAYDAMLAAVDRVRGDFHAKAASGRLDLSTPKDGSAGPPSLFAHSELRLSPDRLVRLRSRLAEVFDELFAEMQNEPQGGAAGEVTDGAEDAVDVTVLTLLYGVRPERPSRADSHPATDS